MTGLHSRFSKYQLATALAILFHVIGAAGLLFFKREFFLAATPFNLLLMLALLWWTQRKPAPAFYIFLACCLLTGLAVEIVGVQTGALFGHYNYGEVMGYKLMDVPLLLGVNWFIVVYCSGMAAYHLYGRLAAGTGNLGVVLLGAFLAVGYDWLMEPVAIKLGYWQWGADGSIPIYNYVCWTVVSFLLLLLFRFARFSKDNKFGVNLLLIQLLFFLLLRLFLN